MSSAKRRRKESEEEKPKLVLTSNPHDVLLGRGNQVNGRSGNIQFRELAQQRALEYSNCESKLEKDSIARQVVAEIQKRGGRFLRTVVVENKEGEQMPAYQIVDMETTLTKAKQTLRDNAAALKRGNKKKKPRETAEIPTEASWPNDPSPLLMSQSAGSIPSSSLLHLQNTQLQLLSESLQHEQIQQAQQQQRLLELLGGQRSILSSQLPVLPDPLAVARERALYERDLSSQALLEIQRQNLLAQQLRDRDVLAIHRQLMRERELTLAAQQSLLQQNDPLAQTQLQMLLGQSNTNPRTSILGPSTATVARLPSTLLGERVPASLPTDSEVSMQRKRKAPPKEPPQESPKK